MHSLMHILHTANKTLGICQLPLCNFLLFISETCQNMFEHRQYLLSLRICVLSSQTDLCTFVPMAGEQTKIKPLKKNNKRAKAFCLFRGTVLGNFLENRIECHFVQSTGRSREKQHFQLVHHFGQQSMF